MLRARTVPQPLPRLPLLPLLLLPLLRLLLLPLLRLPPLLLLLPLPLKSLLLTAAARRSHGYGVIIPKA